MGSHLHTGTDFQLILLAVWMTDWSNNLEFDNSQLDASEFIIDHSFIVIIISNSELLSLLSCCRNVFMTIGLVNYEKDTSVCLMIK